DNGTSSKITSQFQGRPYAGGKGKTNRHGTHVPMIASWPAQMTAGRVSTDLISTTDFVPTLCEMAGIPVPAQVDGVSFLPQLKGQPGTPREWLYGWYSPRQRPDLTVQEFAFDHRFKLYRDHRFFDLVADPLEKEALALESLTGEAAAAATRLARVLDQFKDARPVELDEAFLRASGGMKKKKRQK
ncbi:MAG: sulfatase/phosphatase domain-containing protein, partial [Verrucomicrobiota bacterium]